MISGDQVVEWLHGCCFGVREWMQDIETTGTALRRFLDHDFLLPEVNVVSLQDPLSDSAFTVPESKTISANQSDRPVTPRNTSSSAVHPGRVSTVAPADLSQASKNSAPKKPAPNGNWISYGDLKMLAVWPKDKASVPTGRQSMETMGSITLSSVLAKIENIEGLDIPSNSGEEIGSTAGAGPSQSVIVARPEAFVRMYETMTKESSRRLHDWVSNPSEEMPVSGSEQKSSAEAASYGSSGRVNPEIHDHSRASRIEKKTAALDVLASAAMEAVMAPAAKALDGAVSGSKPDAIREQSFVSALDRLAETLNTLEGRLAGSSHAMTDSKRAEQTDPGEILWLEEEELAGRLQTILKRQARRRGIDLS